MYVFEMLLRQLSLMVDYRIQLRSCYLCHVRCMVILCCMHAARVCVYIYIYTHTCIYIYIYIYVYTPVYIYIQRDIYVYMYICICVLLLIYDAMRLCLFVALAVPGAAFIVFIVLFGFGLHPVSISRFPLRRFSPGAQKSFLFIGSG